MIAAGGITWANVVLFGSDQSGQDDVFTTTAKIGMATGVAAGVLYLMERAAPDLAVAFAWATLITVLFVRTNKGKEPTPLEKIFGQLQR